MKLFSEIILEAESQSDMHLTLDCFNIFTDSFAFTVTMINNTDDADNINDTDTAKSIENCTEKHIQIDQSACDKETSVQLKIESLNKQDNIVI